MHGVARCNVGSECRLNVYRNVNNTETIATRNLSYHYAAAVRGSMPGQRFSTTAFEKFYAFVSTGILWRGKEIAIVTYSSCLSDRPREGNFRLHGL